MRRTCEECKVNVAYRWYLGLSVYDDISNYSTWSQNYIRRYKESEVFNQIFDTILNQVICREIILSGHEPVIPYKRPMTGKGLLKKYEYAYDEYYDCYVCPNNEILSYSTTDKNGYKLYKSNPEKCKNCQKVITSHICEEYKEQVNENRYTKLWKDNYPLRKETIERTFGDCKEQHGLRFTRVRGLCKNEQNATMIFAFHNLKKMANWRQKSHLNSTIISIIL